MKHRKTAALIAAVALLSGAGGYLLHTPEHTPLYGYAGQFGDINGDGAINASDAAIILSYSAYVGAGGKDSLAAWMEQQKNPETTEPGTTEPSGGLVSNTDSTLTILSWYNSSISDAVSFYRDLYPEAAVEIREVGYNSTEAASKYETYLNAGNDADLIVLSNQQVSSYINNADLTVPLSALGIQEAEYADAYPYTLELGKNRSGALCAAFCEAAPGCYVYNTTLAEQYLGVKTPEEMQAKIGDWDKFENAA